MSKLLKIFLAIIAIIVSIIVGFYVVLNLWSWRIVHSFIEEKKNPKKYDYMIEEYKNYYEQNEKNTNDKGDE